MRKCPRASASVGRALLVFLCVLSLQACQKQDSDTKALTTGEYRVTNRMPPGGNGMATNDPVQCNAGGNAYPYTGPEEMNNLPIAGVDGGTFGANDDGIVGNACGQCAMFRGTKFIVVDRIWQNDGSGAGTYTGSSSNRQRTGRAGYGQIDVAGSVANQWLEEDRARNASDSSVTYGDQDMHVEATSCN